MIKKQLVCRSCEKTIIFPWIDKNLEFLRIDFHVNIMITLNDPNSFSKDNCYDIFTRIFVD